MSASDVGIWFYSREDSFLLYAHMPLSRGISAPAARPNALFSLPKNLQARFSPPYRTVIGPFPSPVITNVPFLVFFPWERGRPRPLHQQYLSRID
jgi:hypothetical protein